MTWFSLNKCTCGIATDLRKASVRSAPRVRVSESLGTKIPIGEETVEVIEPKDKHPLQRPAILHLRTDHTAFGQSPKLRSQVHTVFQKGNQLFYLEESISTKRMRERVSAGNKRYYQTCKVSSNCSMKLSSHTRSRLHRIPVDSKPPIRCKLCNRLFDSRIHLGRHGNGAAHLKVVVRRNP